MTLKQALQHRGGAASRPPPSVWVPEYKWAGQMCDLYDPFEPTPHQVEDAEKMAGEDSFLWADPGTGKTLTALEAYKRGGYTKLIIVCPKIAVSMWVYEVQRQLGIPRIGIRAQLSAYHPVKKRNKKAFFPFQFREVFITTSDLVRTKKMVTYMKRFICQPGPLPEGRCSENTRHKAKVAIVLDEAHYFKNPTAARTIAVHGKSPRSHPFGLAEELKADAVWQLTGTPMTRYADDLFIQLYPYCKEILKHYKVDGLARWKSRFCRMELKKYHERMQPKQVVVGNKNLELLNEVLEACGVIRRRLEDVVENLPEVVYRLVDVEHEPVPDGDIPADMAHLMRELNKPDSGLSKVRRLLGIAKAGGVADYVSSEESGTGPYLIGYWHKDVGKALEQYLAHQGVVANINGETPDTKRDEYIGRFNDGRIHVLLGQVRAMGVAANLQAACNHVMLAEEIPDAEALRQFVARVHRRGQKNNVQVDICTSTHELDDALRGVRLNKKSGADTIMKRKG
jgi:SNF2 family DNA or RNA helicase